MGDRADEVDGLADAERRGDSLEPFLLALVSIARVRTENQQPGGLVAVGPQLGQRADGDLYALQTLEPADEQQQRTVAGVDLRARLGAIDGPERGQVHAR